MFRLLTEEGRQIAFATFAALLAYVEARMERDAPEGPDELEFI